MRVGLSHFVLFFSGRISMCVFRLLLSRSLSFIFLYFPPFFILCIICMSFLFPFFFLLLLFFIVPFLVFLYFLAFIILTDSLNLSRLRFSKVSVDAPSVGSLFASRFALEVGYLVSACVTRVSSPFVCLFVGLLFVGGHGRFSWWVVRWAG